MTDWFKSFLEKIAHKDDTCRQCYLQGVKMGYWLYKHRYNLGLKALRRNYGVGYDLEPKDSESPRRFP